MAATTLIATAGNNDAPAKLYTYTTPHKFALQNKLTLSKKITDENLSIDKAIKTLHQGNKVYVIDDCNYATTALAAAGWVASDTAATSGIVVTEHTEEITTKTATYGPPIMTTGSAYSGPVTVTKTIGTAASPVDISEMGYVGWWAHTGTAADFGATDLDIVFTDANGSTATEDVPAYASSDDYWDYFDLALADFTESLATGYAAFDWSKVISVGLIFGAAHGNGETYVIDEMIAFKYSNGSGPAYGTLIPAYSDTDGLLRGEWVKPSPGAMLRVTEASAADEEAFGICCYDVAASATDGTTLIQIDGLFNARLSAHASNGSIVTGGAIELDTDSSHFAIGTPIEQSIAKVLHTYTDTLTNSKAMIVRAIMTPVPKI